MTFPVHNPRLVFALLLPAFLLGHLGLRLLESQSLRWDECEQTLFTQQLALGYNDQPPVYTWLLWGVFQITGVSLLGVYLFKTLVLAAIYLGLFGVCRRLMPNTFAVPATLSLLLTPYFAWSALMDGAHTPFVTAFVPALVLVVFRLIDKPTTFGFILLGLVLGFGFLAKYSFLLLAIALPAAMVTMPEYRRRLLDYRIVLSAAIAAVIVWPHTRWVLDHWQLISARPMERGGVGGDSSFLPRVADGLWSLVETVFYTAAPLLAALVIFFPRACLRTSTERSERGDVRLMGRFLGIVGAMLLFLILIGVSRFRTHWLIPIMVIFPAYVIARAAERPLASWRLRGFTILIVVAAIAVVGIRVGRIVKENREGGKEWGRDQMYRELAERVPTNATYIGDAPIACGNLRLRHPHLKIVCLYYPAFVPPTLTDEPCYVIWDATYIDRPVPSTVGALGRLNYVLEPSEVFFVDVPSESRDRNLRRVGVMRLHVTPRNP